MLLGVVALVWVLQGWMPMDEGEEDKAAAAQALERSVDVAMTLDRELGDGGPVVDFLIGSGDPAATREWLEYELEVYDLEGETEMDDLVVALEGGKRSEDSLLAALVTDGRAPDVEEWKDLEDYYEGLPWYGVQASAFRAIAGENGPGWVGEGLEWRGVMERWMLWGTLAGAAGTALFMLAGLAGVREVWRSVRLAPPAPRRLALWPAGWVLMAYLLSDLAANLGLVQVYGVLSHLDEWPSWVDIGIDAAWRLGGVGLLIWLMFPEPGLAWRWFGMERPVGWAATLGWLSLLLVVGSVWYSWAAAWFPEPAYVSFDEDGWWGLFYSVLSGVILAPLCEEIVYRGVMFAGLWRKLGFWWAAGISSLIFTVIHHYGVAGTVGVFLLGVGCCVLYRRTGSLKGPMILHAVYNGLITIGSWASYNAPFSLGPP